MANESGISMGDLGDLWEWFDFAGKTMENLQSCRILPQILGRPVNDPFNQFWIKAIKR